MASFIKCILPQFKQTKKCFGSEERADRFQPLPPLDLQVPENLTRARNQLATSPDKSTVVRNWVEGPATRARSSPPYPASCVISGRLLTLSESQLSGFVGSSRLVPSRLLLHIG